MFVQSTDYVPLRALNDNRRPHTAASKHGNTIIDFLVHIVCTVCGVPIILMLRAICGPPEKEKKS